MARYIDADKLIDKIFPFGLVHDGKYTINAKAVKLAIDQMPTADVAPKRDKYFWAEDGKPPVLIETSENRRNEIMRDIISDLKRLIHENAVYPHNSGVSAYISIKAFDAILNNYLNSLK